MSSPEMPPTPPESVHGDLPAIDRWTELARRVHDDRYSEEVIEPDEHVREDSLDIHQGKRPWHAIEQTDFAAVTEEQLLINSNDWQRSDPWTVDPNTNSYEPHPISLPQGFTGFDNSSSSGTGRGQSRRLTETTRRNARLMRKSGCCFRCFVMKEKCYLDGESSRDGGCSRCRQQLSHPRIQRLPCTSRGLGERASYLFPNALTSHLRPDNIRIFIHHHVGGLVPNSPFGLSLTMGFGAPLILVDVVEFVPRGTAVDVIRDIDLLEYDDLKTSGSTPIHHFYHI